MVCKKLEKERVMPLLFCLEPALSSDSVRRTSSNRRLSNSNEADRTGDCSALPATPPHPGQGSVVEVKRFNTDMMGATLLIYKHKHWHLETQRARGLSRRSSSRSGARETGFKSAAVLVPQVEWQQSTVRGSQQEG